MAASGSLYFIDIWPNIDDRRYQGARDIFRENKGLKTIRRNLISISNCFGVASHVNIYSRNSLHYHSSFYRELDWTDEEKICPILSHNYIIACAFCPILSHFGVWVNSLLKTRYDSQPLSSVDQLTSCAGVFLRTINTTWIWKCTKNNLIVFSYLTIGYYRHESFAYKNYLPADCCPFKKCAGFRILYASGCKHFWKKRKPHWNRLTNKILLVGN